MGRTREGRADQEHHSALVHLRWQLSGQGDHLQLVLLTENMFTQTDREEMLLSTL